MHVALSKIFGVEQLRFRGRSDQSCQSTFTSGGCLLYIRFNVPVPLPRKRHYTQGSSLSPHHRHITVSNIGIQAFKQVLSVASSGKAGNITADDVRAQAYLAYLSVTPNFPGLNEALYLALNGNWTLLSYTDPITGTQAAFSQGVAPVLPSLCLDFRESFVVILNISGSGLITSWSQLPRINTTRL